MIGLIALQDGDIGEYALSLIEKDIGRSLNAEERARILARAEVKASDMMSLQ